MRTHCDASNIHVPQQAQLDAQLDAEHGGHTIRPWDHGGKIRRVFSTAKLELWWHCIVKNITIILLVCCEKKSVWVQVDAFCLLWDCFVLHVWC